MTERREDIADESKSRERFEKWYSKGHKFSFVRRIDIPEAYEDGETEVRWYTWQAAERDTRERCVEQVLALRDKTSTGAYWEALNTVAEAIRKGGE